MTPPTGRLAPSPTGYLHLGHARTFLLAWWQARSAGGRLLLRFEDLDRGRVRAGMERAAIEDLEWLGIDWDGPIVRQSERGALYREALAQLDAQGLLYPCVCSRREIAEAQSAPQGEGAAAYPGTCRGRFQSPAEARRKTGREPALRMRVPPGLRTVRDEIRGLYREDLAREVGDFPVTRRDGEIAYQLAVVVDDHDQGVNEVLRGDDLLPSTLRQALLQESLGLPHPRWFHVPLVVDEQGQRLAKRRGETALAALRAAGVRPGAIVRWAALSAGAEERGEGLAAAYLPGFDLGRLPAEPALTFSQASD